MTLEIIVTDNNKKWFVNQLLDLLDQNENVKMNKLSPTKKWILVSLAKFADRKGECIPSYQRIANMTGYSKKAVINNIWEMEIDGFLRIQERYKTKKYRNSNKITIFKDKIEDYIVNYVHHNGEPYSGDSEPGSTEIVNDVHLNYPYKHNQETTQEKVVSFYDIQKQLTEIFDNAKEG
jgi:hypothetical protein